MDSSTLSFTSSLEGLKEVSLIDDGSHLQIVYLKFTSSSKVNFVYDKNRFTKYSLGDNTYSFLAKATSKENPDISAYEILEYLEKCNSDKSLPQISVPVKHFRLTDSHNVNETYKFFSSSKKFSF